MAPYRHPDSASAAPFGRQCSTGFTLLELMAVVSILGMMLFLVLPNLDGMLPTARVNSAAREIAATIEFARSQAIFTAKPYEVHLDIDGRWYQVLNPDQLEDRNFSDGSEGHRAYLPTNIRIKDVSFASGVKKERGLVKIRLSPFGRFDEFAVHLYDIQRDEYATNPWTVHFNPLTGVADFYDHEEPIGQISESELFKP